MLDLATYKATFKTINKYLKHFCDTPASDWTLKKYKRYFSDKDTEKIKKVFVENLQTVKDDAKNIPSVVNQHINRLMKTFSSVSSAPISDPYISSSSNINNITACKLLFIISHTMLTHSGILSFGEGQLLQHKY